VKWYWQGWTTVIAENPVSVPICLLLLPYWTGVGSNLGLHTDRIVIKTHELYMHHQPPPPTPLITNILITQIYKKCIILFSIAIFFYGSTAPWGPRPPHYQGFTITHFRHATLVRTPLDEWPARRTDLTTHNIHKRQTSMSPAEFEPAVSASERPQTHA
jgi:hypothetical protein